MTAAAPPTAPPYLSKPMPSPKRKTGPQQSMSFIQGAIEAMARVRSGRGHCVFTFTSPHRKAGTSYVVNLIAEELASQFDAKVALVPTEALKGCDPKQLPQGFIEQSPNLWVAVPNEALNHMPDFAIENVWISPGAQGFDFVLIDCPSMEASPLALRWATETDGVVMVVQAGKTRVEQIETAQRLLQASTGRLEGLILNRRTYPIPKFLYKFL